MSADRYDVAVIGGGMIGAPAARHLAEAGHRVVVIAAPEPANLTATEGPFASHYDAGRITRRAERNPVWAELAHRSIERYGAAEDRAGIRFHDPRGLAWIGNDLDVPIAEAVARGGSARIVEAAWLERTTGIRTPAELSCAYEEAPAGLIDPQRFIAAQLRLAELAAAQVIGSAVEAVERSADGLRLQGPFGQVTVARVLLATGAYGSELVGVALALEPWLRTTLRLDMGPAPELSSLIIAPVDHPNIADAYWVPPVRFSDGRVLFKIGGEWSGSAIAQSKTELTEWFQSGGSAAEAEALLDVTRMLLPNATIADTHHVPCVVTRTTTGLPYVGWLDDGVAVAYGGNGSAAKSGDEIGRLAAGLFSPEGWVGGDDLAAELFAPVVA